MCKRKKLSWSFLLFGMSLFLTCCDCLAQNRYTEIEVYRALLERERLDSSYHKAWTQYLEAPPIVSPTTTDLQKQFNTILSLPKSSVAELDQVIDRLEVLVQEAIQKQVAMVELQAQTELFTIFFWKEPKQYRKAFMIAEQLKQRLSELSDTHVQSIREAYVKLGEAYYIFKDYATSIQLLANVIDKPSQSFTDRTQLEALRISGICYANIPGGMPQSDSCFLAMMCFPELLLNRPVYQALALSNLAWNAMLQGDFDKALALCLEVLPILKLEHDYGHIAGMYACQGRSYLAKGDYAMLRSIIDSLQIYAHKDNYNPSKRFKQLYKLSSTYYSAIGEAATAQLYHDSLVNLYKMEEQEYGSHFISDAARELREQELERRKEQLVRQENFILTVLIILALLSLVTMLIVRLYRKRNAAYKVLARKADEWAHGNANSHGLAASSESNRKTLKKSVTAEDRQIMSQVANEMRSRHAYREVDLTMDLLAERLGVSRHSLSGAINRSTGTNFYQYINSFRIKEAVKLISKNDHKELYIDELFGRVGFSNRTTFYRVFKQLTGFSPAEFQKNYDRH